MVSLLYVLMGLGANFTMTNVESSAKTHANCHYNIYQHTFSKGYLCYKSIFCHKVALDV